MRPILLKGHERSITHIRYNRDGDLLFTCSKALFPCVWYSTTGERLGTYNGHTGAVWSLDVDYDTNYLLTGSADRTVKLWEVETGRELASITHKSPIRWVEFAEGDKQFLAVIDSVMGYNSTIYIHDISGSSPQAQSNFELVVPGAKIAQAVWGPMGKTIITCADDGAIRVFDVGTRKQIDERKDHAKAVNRITMDKHRLFFITGSKDCTAKLYDAKTMNVLKTYDTGRPVNAASISPLKEHVIVGGGQNAEGVTTSGRGDTAQFKVRFFQKILGDELGSVQGHFGPVNTLSFSPDGRSFASGGEDGYVRVHHFDQSYFNTK